MTGADGNLWVTENRASAIARVTTSGDVTEFPTPTPDSRPLEITAGPDGRVWFVEVRPSQIARTQVLGCTAHRTGLVSGPLNLTSGATCITGAQVSGPITVGPGASLFVDNSRVTGDVTSDGAGVLRLCGTQVQSGSVVARRTVDAVVIGDPSQGCGGDDVSGSVTLTDNAAPTDVVGATTIGGDLGCTGNTPPPADGGQPAAVGGTRSGQCATASTTSTTASTTTTTTTAATSTTTTVVANPSVCTVLAQQLQATADPATRAALESVRRTLSCP